MAAADERVVIRPATAKDFGAMVTISAEVFGPYALEAHIEELLGPAGRTNWLEMKAASLRRELAARPDACFVAELAGRVVGYVTNSIYEAASRGTVANLAVTAGCQGRGIGRRLLLRSLERFRALGLRQAKIETLACNEAGRHLYPSVGFREVVSQIHYIMPLD